MFKKLILGIMRRGCSWLCSRGWSRRRGGGKWPGVWWGWSWRWSTCDCARWCGGWTSGGSGTTWSLSQVWLASPVHLDPLCQYQRDSFQPPPPWVISARPQPCPVKMSMNFMNSMHFNQDASLQHDLIVVILGWEGPPALGPLLLEQVDGGHGAVSPQHVQGAETRTPGAPGELGQVQSDRAQEVIFGEWVRIPNLLNRR